MDRIIKISELRDAINEAYEEFKSIKNGEVDPRLGGINEDLFGISVALADGTVINKGDSNAVFPLGQLSRVPVTTLRVEQKAKQQAMNDAKDGAEKECHCMAKKNVQERPDIPFSPRGIKAISKLQPTGDFDSKWNFIENRMISLAGSAPQLDIQLYETLKAQSAEAKVVDTINKDGFKLADNAAQSVDLYLRANAMTVNTQQLAEMGATILADGVNPFTRQIVFDGELSQRIVARMAMKNHKLRRFIMKTGVAAASGFGGGVLGIVPGVLSIAAYSPRLCERGNSVKGMRAIAYIMNKLNISMFGSAKVVIEK
ncbi:MAG: glutaminase [Muribaculaceae bacterium]|nr:glutaminase [Muribaculaceae bacterium]